MFSVSPNEGTTTWMAVDQLGAVIARSPRPNVCQWLAPSESERMATMSRRVRQDQFLAGRWLLREMLTSLFPPTQPTDWRLGGIAGKAPSILGCPPGASLRMPLFLSVSHSGERVAAAVSTSPIGVDLECIRPRRNLLELAALACDESEQLDLKSQDADARAIRFHLIWAIKEAWLKCWGDALDPARLQQLHTRAGHEVDSWSVWACHSTGWVLALACPSSACIQWTGECIASSDLSWEAFTVQDDHRTLPGAPEGESGNLPILRLPGMATALATPNPAGLTPPSH